MTRWRGRAGAEGGGVPPVSTHREIVESVKACAFLYADGSRCYSPPGSIIHSDSITIPLGPNPRDIVHPFRPAYVPREEQDALQARYDRLRQITDNALNLVSADSASDRSSVDSLRGQLAALDAEVK